MTDCSEIKNKYNRNTEDSQWDDSNLPTGITRDDIFECTGVCGPNMYIDLNMDQEIPKPSCKVCDDSDKNPQCYEDNWYDIQLSANILKTNYKWPEKSIWDIFNPDKLIYKKSDGKYEDIEDNKVSDLLKNDSRNVFIKSCKNLLDKKDNSGFLNRLGMSKSEALKSCEILNSYLQSYNPLTDDEILRLINCDYNYINKDGDIVSICNNNKDIISLRNAIHEKRGNNVPMSKIVMERWSKNYEDFKKETSNITVGFNEKDLVYIPRSTYTNKHIIQSEVYDYITDLKIIKQKKNPMGIDFGKIANNLNLNTDFETCMSTILDTNLNNKVYCGDKKYEDIENEISKLNRIIDIEDCHLDYIEDRLKSIAKLKIDDIDECIKTYNLTETFDCDESLSNKTLKIAYLIFHLVGFENIDIINIKRGTPDYQKIKVIIDRLSPLIKPSIHKLVEISKHYEMKTCEKQSATTYMLDSMYKNLFDKSDSYKIDLNQIKLIPESIEKGNIENFSRSIIWMLSIGFFIYIVLKAISLLG